MSTIVRKSPLPRYYQLKEIMREKIRSGEWKPGDLIPSERELGEQYGISRMTARQAITELVNEGLFYREQGKGTFVSRRKITQQLIHLTGFTEDMKARGQQPGTRVLSAEMRPAEEAVAERLRIKPGSRSSASTACVWLMGSHWLSRSRISALSAAKNSSKRTWSTIPSIACWRPNTACPYWKPIRS